MAVVFRRLDGSTPPVTSYVSSRIATRATTYDASADWIHSIRSAQVPSNWLPATSAAPADSQTGQPVDIADCDRGGILL
jgi:hypothetical protein